MTDPTYDPRIAAKLQAYAQAGVSGFDSLEVATIASTAGIPRRLGRPWLLLLVAAVMIGGAALAALATGAGRLLEPARSGSIVFARDGVPLPAIWRVDVATGESVGIVSEGVSDAISPDGSHAAWLDETLTQVHLGDLRANVWVKVQAGGTVAIRDRYTFTWSPSGRWVSWAACSDVTTCRLIVSASDGSQLTTLEPSFPRSQIDHQAWLFWADDDSLRVKFADGRGFLAANADGTDVRPLVGPLSPDPDGGTTSAGDSLTIYRADGTVRWTVGFDGRQVTGALWSPDRARVLVGLEDGPSWSTSSLALLDQDGRRIPANLPAGGGIEGALWAPDSSRVFVVTSAQRSSLTSDGAIIGRDGEYISGIDAATIVAWSPDSRQLAVVEFGSNTISVMDADGSDRQRLVGPAPGSIDQLAWLP